MMRKITALLLVLLLSGAGSLAETAGNAFVGTWLVTHCVVEGALTTPGMDGAPDTIVFTEDEMTILSAGEGKVSISYTVSGDAALIGDAKFSMLGDGRAQLQTSVSTMLLQKVDDMQGRIQGTWIGEYSVDSDGDASEIWSCVGMEETPILVVNGSTVQLIEGDFLETCTLQNGALLDDEGEERYRVMLDGDILMVEISSGDIIYCYREDSEIPANTAPFIGNWKILMAMRDGKSYTDITRTMEDEGLSFDMVAFGRMSVNTFSPYYANGKEPIASALCEYNGGKCIMTLVDEATVAAVDAGGMMTMNYGDWTLMLVRAQ